MPAAAEFWYVRLPDGRTVRARSADVLRSYLRAGRIPWESRVRRVGQDEWQPLDHVAEFADLHAPEPAPAPAPGNDMRAVGVRGLIEELFNAFDSTIQRGKLMTAAGVAILFAVGWIALDVVADFPLGAWTTPAEIGIAIVVLAGLAAGTVILTRMTFIELDRHRPARPAEIQHGLLGQTLRVLIVQGLIVGLIGTLIWFFRAASPWLSTHNLGELNDARNTLLTVVAVLRLLLEVLCWPILGLAVLLLGPLVIIEEYSLVGSLREWFAMLRRHLGRIYLYEALALAMAAVMALPMLLVVAIASQTVAAPAGLAERITLSILTGVSLTPLIAYLLVANVFIYLNLRYEFFVSARA
jgi:hypothetical protein